ncbi:hypothetical protein H0H87_007250 [Tephrocybe sp. NHM501043]|nr:hypothetical protein H0H87_007250 [Tephrocybe sp. NHM501043]
MNQMRKAARSNGTQLQELQLTQFCNDYPELYNEKRGLEVRVELLVRGWFVVIVSKGVELFYDLESYMDVQLLADEIGAYGHNYRYAIDKMETRIQGLKKDTATMHIAASIYALRVEKLFKEQAIIEL